MSNCDPEVAEVAPPRLNGKDGLLVRFDLGMLNLSRSSLGNALNGRLEVSMGGGVGDCGSVSPRSSQFSGSGDNKSSNLFSLPCLDLGVLRGRPPLLSRLDCRFTLVPSLCFLYGTYGAGDASPIGEPRVSLSARSGCANGLEVSRSRLKSARRCNALALRFWL